MKASSDFATVYLELGPEGRPLLLISVLSAPGPAPIRRDAEVLARLAEQTGERDHLLDAAQMLVLGGMAARASQLLGSWLTKTPHADPEVALRLAGARAAVGLGAEFPRYFLDLISRLSPAESPTEAQRRAGALLSLVNLTDLALFDLRTAASLGVDEVTGLMRALWGPLVVHAGSPIVGLQASIQGSDLDGMTPASIVDQAGLLAQAMGQPVPPPDAEQQVRSWAKSVLTRCGIGPGPCSPRAVLHLAEASASDHQLEQLDDLIARAPNYGPALTARALARTVEVARAGANLSGEALRETLISIHQDVAGALALRADDILALMVKGCLYADCLGEAQSAISTYEQVLATCPFHPQALRFRGVNRLRMADERGHHDLALASRLIDISA